MKFYSNVAMFFVIALAVFLTAGSLLFNYYTGPVNKKDSKTVDFIVEQNSTYLTIADDLKSANLIKSETAYKLCVKIFTPKTLEAGIYKLDKSMGVLDILHLLERGSNYNANAINITFKEGLNMRAVAKLIDDNTDNTTNDVYNLLKDNAYLDSLIKEYWFLDNSIKDKNIYYSLEGYLFPDTYQILKDSTVADIFKIMLDETDNKLTPYKDELLNNKYSIHEIMTLASIIELEAGNSDDRAGVAGVFYNRLNNNWQLGSDVTTYYGIKVELHERDLYDYEIKTTNAYNTRSPQMAGKLPVSPICNPGIESIKAALNPKSHAYFYFVADKNGKTYFNVDGSGHTATINYLKENNLWYTY